MTIHDNAPQLKFQNKARVFSPVEQRDPIIKDMSQVHQGKLECNYLALFIARENSVISNRIFTKVQNKMTLNTINSNNSQSKSPNGFISPTGQISNVNTKYTTLSPDNESSVADTAIIKNLRAKHRNKRLSMFY